VSALARFLRLNREERGLVVRAASTVVLVRVALTILPFRWLRALVRKERHRGKPGRHSPEELARAVARVSRRVPRATCLTQALALQSLLTRDGHVGTLRIGVAKDHGRLRAHAWVENEHGILIGGEEAARFLPLGSAQSARSERAS
jgi:Transglutaminase-like superfamily